VITLSVITLGCAYYASNIGIKKYTFLIKFAIIEKDLLNTNLIVKIPLTNWVMEIYFLFQIFKQYYTNIFI